MTGFRVYRLAEAPEELTELATNGQPDDPIVVVEKGQDPWAEREAFATLDRWCDDASVLKRVAHVETHDTPGFVIYTVSRAD